MILDIGGNLGYTAIGFSLALQNANIDIYSFEPYPPNHRFFKKNTLKHNVTLMPFGLGDESKVMDIGLPDYTYDILGRDDRANTGRVSLVGIEKSLSDNSSHKAYIVHGDQLLKTMYMDDKVLFIKIDVEGFEIDVLKGLSETIKTSMPFIQMEANPVTMEMSNEGLSSFRDFAIAHGYCIYLFNKGELMYLDANDFLPEGVCEILFCPAEFRV